MNIQKTIMDHRLSFGDRPRLSSGIERRVAFLMRMAYTFSGVDWMSGNCRPTDVCFIATFNVHTNVNEKLFGSIRVSSIP